MILTEAQKNYLIDKVNEKVNLPILGERGERKVFAVAIDKVLEKLRKELPEEIQTYLNDVSDGFVPGGEGDMEDAVKSTVEVLNKEINIPLMNEKKEAKLFTIVVETLFDAMQKGKKLETQQ